MTTVFYDYHYLELCREPRSISICATLWSPFTNIVTIFIFCHCCLLNFGNKVSNFKLQTSKTDADGSIDTRGESGMA